MCFVKDLVKFLQGSSCRIRFRLISQDCTASRFHGWDSGSWLPLHTVCHYFLPPGYFFPGHVETEVCWGLYLNPIHWTTSLVIPSLSPSIVIWHYLPRKSLFPYALKAGSIFPFLSFMSGTTSYKVPLNQTTKHELGLKWILFRCSDFSGHI